MKLRRVWFTLVLGVLSVCASLAWAQPAPSGTIQLTDDRGRPIRLHGVPKRVVSILPSLTEMVCKLDQCAKLVGVDRYSAWPAEVLKLPQVGGGLDPNIEAIVALRPDVVLAGTSSRAADRLIALGIPVVALEPKTHADVRRVLDKIGVTLGVSDAQRVWRIVDAGVSAVAQSLPPQVRHTRVYFEVNSGPYGAGESSFIGETLTRLGARNILPANLGPFPKLNPEYIVRANPDVIMIGERNVQGLTQRPGWQNIRAVREGRICVFPPDEADVLVRPGPRMADAARLMGQCLAEKAPLTPGKGSLVPPAAVVNKK